MAGISHHILTFPFPLPFCDLLFKYTKNSCKGTKQGYTSGFWKKVASVWEKLSWCCGHSGLCSKSFLLTWRCYVRTQAEQCQTVLATHSSAVLLPGLPGHQQHPPLCHSASSIPQSINHMQCTTPNCLVTADQPVVLKLWAITVFMGGGHISDICTSEFYITNPNSSKISDEVAKEITLWLGGHYNMRDCIKGLRHQEGWEPLD